MPSPTTPPTVDALPTAPTKGVSSGAAFVALCDAFFGAMAAFRAQLNALAANVYANAGGAYSDASAASSSASSASGSASAASGSAAAAAGSATTAAGWSATSTTSMALTAGATFITIQAAKQFTAGTNIKIKRTSAPSTTYVDTKVDAYNNVSGRLDVTLSAGYIVGSGTFTDWTVELSGSPGPAGTGITPLTTGFSATGGTTTPKTITVDENASITALLAQGKQARVARAASTTITASDLGKFIDITTGGTQAITAAATLGADFWCDVQNSSTTDVTLDPNGSETIGSVNAGATAVLKPGQSARIQGNATAIFFVSIPTSFKNMEIFTASGTFTPKPGVTRYWVYLKGGGGGGVGTSTATNAIGGSEGGECQGFVNLTAAQTVTIGAGGTSSGVSGNYGAGTDRGNTTFGALATANGGKVATAATSPQLGGAWTFSGGTGQYGAASFIAFGGASPGAGRGGGTVGNSGAVGYGGGGAGGYNTGTPGAGFAGICIVMW